MPSLKIPSRPLLESYSLGLSVTLILSCNTTLVNVQFLDRFGRRFYLVQRICYNASHLFIGCFFSLSNNVKNSIKKRQQDSDIMLSNSITGSNERIFTYI